MSSSIPSPRTEGVRLVQAPPLSVAFTRGIGGDHKPNRGATDEWLTPPELLKALGPFDLDPCAPVDRPWDTAREHYTIRENGLWKPWRGRVWLNPPYGPQTGTWLARLAEHGNGVALIFARTETRFFHDHGWHRADAMLFLRGRLNFHDAAGIRSDKNAGGPSVLIAYGVANAAALRRSTIDGFYLPMPDPYQVQRHPASGPGSARLLGMLGRKGGEA